MSAVLSREYPVDAQETFGKEAAAAIGFEFDRGRLDVTAILSLHDAGAARLPHHDPLRSALFQCGLFRYFARGGPRHLRQGLPPDRFGLPLGEAVSLGIHESQSRMWENLVGRSLAFWRYFYPAAKLVSRGARGRRWRYVLFAINDVRPSLIRTRPTRRHNLHVLLRFEWSRRCSGASCRRLICRARGTTR